MDAFRPLSTVEQLAAHLRGEILGGGLGETMPGVNRLASTLGVSPRTAIAAVKQLEREGMLLAQGPRRRSRTVVPEDFAPRALRVTILPYEETDRALDYVLDLQYRLMEAGHAAGFAARNLLDLEMDAKRVARLVSKTSADAWVIVSGSREVLEWFAEQPAPAFALFGRRRNVPIAAAGPEKQPALVQAVDRLVELGHRRIVMLVREERRKPQPGPFERRFLEAMAAHGLATNAYNLPDWDNSAESFRRCLDSLFRVTPPTALIIDQASLFAVAQQHLARRGILAPQHVSLVSCDPDPAFDWFHPTVAHIRWEPQQVVRRILHWADNVTRGKDDRGQTLTKAEFIEGGTIGPAI